MKIQQFVLLIYSEPKWNFIQKIVTVETKGNKRWLLTHRLRCHCHVRVACCMHGKSSRSHTSRLRRRRRRTRPCQPSRVANPRSSRRCSRRRCAWSSDSVRGRWRRCSPPTWPFPREAQRPRRRRTPGRMASSRPPAGTSWPATAPRAARPCSWRRTRSGRRPARRPCRMGPGFWAGTRTPPCPRRPWRPRGPGARRRGRRRPAPEPQLRPCAPAGGSSPTGTEAARSSRTAWSREWRWGSPLTRGPRRTRPAAARPGAAAPSPRTASGKGTQERQQQKRRTKDASAIGRQWPRGAQPWGRRLVLLGWHRHQHQPPCFSICCAAWRAPREPLLLRECEQAGDAISNDERKKMATSATAFVA